MKVIILLAGFGTRMRPHTWSRPKALLTVAGNTVLGHILDEIATLTTDEVIFVVGYKGEQIKNWIGENYGHLDAKFVVQDEALGQAHAVWLCRDYLNEGEVVLAFGDNIVRTDFAGIRSPADATFLIKEFDDPRNFGVVILDEIGYVTKFVEKPETKEHKNVVIGINWFREAAKLRDAVKQVMRENRQTKGEFYMADAYGVMLEQGAKIITKEVKTWDDAGNPANMLQTNRHLLSLDHATDDALERSFAEGFTVQPPVYLHPDCDIEGSVIGPYATVGAGVQIRSSIVRNSIVDENASIENAILDSAMVGANTVIKGTAKALFVGDNSIIEM